MNRVKILMVLVACILTMSAISIAQEDLQRITPPQGQVALTIFVHEGNLSGLQLPGVQVTGKDASGTSFNRLTTSNGSAIIYGQPGAWQFTFSKEGYKPVSLNYNVTKTHEAAAYLQKITQSQGQVALTIFVHEGNLSGSQLPDVQITGTDAAENSFVGITDSNGSAVINGQPGAWQFTFSKEGYKPVSLNYNVTKTHEAAAYLQRTVV